MWGRGGDYRYRHGMGWDLCPGLMWGPHSLFHEDPGLHQSLSLCVSESPNTGLSDLCTKDPLLVWVLGAKPPPLSTTSDISFILNAHRDGIQDRGMRVYMPASQTAWVQIPALQLSGYVILNN